MEKEIKCEICMDDGKCLNNEKNPNYESGLLEATYTIVVII